MMTGFKEHKNDFITFAASQKRGIAWILSLCLLLVFVAPFYKLLMADLSPKQIAEEDKEIINILYDQQEQAEEQEAGPYTELKKTDPQDAVFFDFDPNMAKAEDFAKLGLTPGQIKYILKARSKNIGFKRKRDFEKLVVLGKDWVTKAHNYIQLPDSFEKINFTKKEYVVLDINSADSSMLETLPGIGKYLAAKIVKNRERLGGYVNTEQMRQITNMNIDMYRIASPHLCVKKEHSKININSATKDQLGNHPYIGWKAANNIINYRKQHEKFTEAAQLSKAKILADSSMHKLLPYIDF